MDSIRNFCIIAHIDHGKSTLADRLIEVTGTVSHREMQDQLLDSMELEREKGITIKLQPVTMQWKGTTLNLIDTPGHADFSYEVSRSLAACEGALLVVDASQGIQAQTLANVYLALEANLTIIPILNKIDLPAADPERIGRELANLLGCEQDEIIQVSAKAGTNIEAVLDRVVRDVPPPSGSTDGALRALVFDSVYDEYRGVILYVRIQDGSLASGQKVSLMATSTPAIALEVGIFAPHKQPSARLSTGSIGYIVTNLKSIAEGQVGDTVTLQSNAATEPLAGYQKVKPYVYAGFFTVSSEEYPMLKDALEKLKLNDAALAATPETSTVLGFGFRLGFLGLLHMEIIKERLEREFNLSLVVTNPSVDYVLHLSSGEDIIIQSASQMPDATRVEYIKEPWIKAEIVVPSDYVGAVIQLINSIRGIQKGLQYLESAVALVTFEAPLANVLTDFYDKLKSITSGYGSFNYEIDDYRTDDLVRLDFLVGGERVDSLSLIVHRTEADRTGREIVAKLKDVIPRQLFEVSLQAAIGGKIIAREDVKALGKNVTAKLYGGDVTRKNKLLDKQKKGKKRMKQIGKVEIPTEAFMVLVKKD